MKRIKQFTILRLCIFLILGQNYTFTSLTTSSSQVSFIFDISGYITAEYSMTSNSDHFVTTFGLANSNESWIDSWQGQIDILDISGNSKQTINQYLDKPIVI